MDGRELHLIGSKHKEPSREGLRPPPPPPFAYVAIIPFGVCIGICRQAGEFLIVRLEMMLRFIVINTFGIKQTIVNDSAGGMVLPVLLLTDG